MSARTIRRSCHLAVALAAAVALSGLGAAPSVAHNNGQSSGCTGVTGGWTCFYIWGIGGTTHVERFQQSRGVTSYPQICNYQARFTVSQNGRVYWSRWSAYHQGCFYSWRATRTVWVEGNFRNPSKACGSWYENGSRLGTACKFIYS